MSVVMTPFLAPRTTVAYNINVMKKATQKIPTIDIKKYGGKQVAILDGKVIASGNTSSEVIAKAQKKAPDRPLNEIAIFSVPTTLSVIYHA